MTTGMIVKKASDADQARWDEYAMQNGSFFHRYGWADAIEQSFGQSAVYLFAERDDQVVGILPLIERKSLFFGSALISVGFTTGGGIISEDDEARTALLEAALEAAQSRNAAYIELRSEDDRQQGWHEKHDIYDSFVCEIVPDADARLKSIPRKKRADIRKAIAKAEAGEIKAVITRECDLFWRHFAIAQRDHGTPVFPRDWLKKQQEQFGADFEITLISAGDQPLCGVVSYYHRDRVTLYNAFISPAARAYHAGDYLYWWMMQHAQERGAKWFDLGRSKRGTGSHAYKTFWGIEPAPMVYLYKLIGTDETPNINPQNPKFALMSKAWRRLPMSVASRLGPALSRHLA